MRMLSWRNKSRSREETGSEKYRLTCLRSCSPSVKEPRVAPESHCAILPPSGVSEAKCRAWLSVGSHARSLNSLGQGRNRTGPTSSQDPKADKPWKQGECQTTSLHLSQRLRNPQPGLPSYYQKHHSNEMFLKRVVGPC